MIKQLNRSNELNKYKLEEEEKRAAVTPSQYYVHGLQ